MSKEELILNSASDNTYKVKMICTNCGEVGHTKARCPHK